MIIVASTYVSKNDMSALRHLVPEIENELKVSYYFSILFNYFFLT